MDNAAKGINNITCISSQSISVFLDQIEDVSVVSFLILKVVTSTDPTVWSTNSDFSSASNQVIITYCRQWKQ